MANAVGCQPFTLWMPRRLRISPNSIDMAAGTTWTALNATFGSSVQVGHFFEFDASRSDVVDIVDEAFDFIGRNLGIGP